MIIRKYNKDKFQFQKQENIKANTLSDKTNIYLQKSCNFLDVKTSLSCYMYSLLLIWRQEKKHALLISRVHSCEPVVSYILPSHPEKNEKKKIFGQEVYLAQNNCLVLLHSAFNCIYTLKPEILYYLLFVNAHSW